MSVFFISDVKALAFFDKENNLKAQKSPQK